jgi:choline-sulfatase
MASGERSDGLTRRKLLRTGAAAVPSLLFARQLGLGSAEAAAGGSVKGMNVIVFLTDQERAIQHFPKGWAARNLPGLTRLRRHGLEFTNAFTNACMCSPARSTLMSGLFPAQHGVKYTLEEDMPEGKYPQVELPRELSNLARIAAAAGYTPVYKGKWHCSKPRGSEFEPSDLAEYGFSRWDPPDAGANQDVSEAGGGSIDNDGRYIDSTGEGKAEGALQYLRQVAGGQQPFFMVISLVNPHDVLLYPGEKFAEAGYDESWLEGDIRLPPTVDEDLATKPSVQRQFRRIFNLTGNPKTREEKRAYLNFYGNLMRSSDAYLVDVLDLLTETGLLDDTLIVRTADHGEMGLTHGGLRQKNFNFYEEAIKVPLVYSNPQLFEAPRKTGALVSHVDFLPTMASLLGAPRSARADWQGVDYSRKVLHPRAKAPQDYVVFTYDDYQSGQKHGPYPKPPNHIVSLREQRWKLARYYDVKGRVPDQWEMYDLGRDPNERRNLAHRGNKRTPLEEREYKRLRKKLHLIEKTRLKEPSS